VAGEISRGEIWEYRFGSPNKKRPVLVLTRQPAIALLHTVMVAPIASTIRGAPSEVVVGVANGLKHESVANLDNVQTVEQARLSSYRGSLSAAQMREVCTALAVAVGCDGSDAPSARSFRVRR
jgi:mRNA interferase MazF